MSDGGKRPCPKCGNLNYATEAVCLGCGAELDSGELSDRPLPLPEAPPEPAQQAPAGSILERLPSPPVLLIGSAILAVVCVWLCTGTTALVPKYLGPLGMVIATQGLLCAIVLHVVGWVKYYRSARGDVRRRDSTDTGYTVAGCVSDCCLGCGACIGCFVWPFLLLLSLLGLLL